MVLLPLATSGLRLRSSAMKGAATRRRPWSSTSSGPSGLVSPALSLETSTMPYMVFSSSGCCGAATMAGAVATKEKPIGASAWASRLTASAPRGTTTELGSTGPLTAARYLPWVAKPSSVFSPARSALCWSVSTAGAGMATW